MVPLEGRSEPGIARRALFVVEALLDEGVSSLVAPQGVLKRLEERLQKRPVATAPEWELDDQLDVITIGVLLPVVEGVLVEILQIGPPRFLIVPADTPDPEWRGQLLRQRQHVVRPDELVRGF